MFIWFVAPKKKQLVVCSYFKCFVTIKAIWPLLGKLVTFCAICLPVPSGLWFFLVFINLKATFLHHRDGYITEFICHFHLAKLLSRAHQATFRCKPLASFLLSGAIIIYSPSPAHVQTPTWLPPVMSVISSQSLDYSLAITNGEQILFTRT